MCKSTVELSSFKSFIVGFYSKMEKKVLCIISYMYLLEFILKILVHGCQCTICLRNYIQWLAVLALYLCGGIGILGIIIVEIGVVVNLAPGAPHLDDVCTGSM